MQETRNHSEACRARIAAELAKTPEGQRIIERMQDRTDAAIARRMEEGEEEKRKNDGPSAHRGTGPGKEVGVAGRGPEGSGLARSEEEPVVEVDSAHRGTVDLPPISSLTGQWARERQNILDLRSWDTRKIEDQRAVQKIMIACW